MNIDHIPRPLYIAHRGVCARYPENTLAAFRGAIDAGAHMIELDVTLSKDRRLVVIHDETVDRTTNGQGAVNALTLTRLQQLDAGSWFDSRFAGERLPTLAQVLDAVKGHLWVNIEIKPEAFEKEGPIDAVERQVCDLVVAKRMRDAVLISSFEWRVLERLRLLDARIAIGLLSEGPADEHLGYWQKRLGAFSWHPDYRVLTRPQVDAVHAMGAWVFPYAVNGRIDTRGLLAMGVDGLITDDPDQMRVA
ncbi:Glycerophosphoryl diester phosphodiesterase [Desulfosarcina cetonica]|uniref:glycerophosphodiester phosphodiesterase n=1 Tax=Desulfosarcina cetonica TaxID=90730 RepID=UPI0006CF48A7|nr:glycerophosphodiester phosphodiesterase family protein [Desulfosarcina cetonica]VTR69186.1 Glycerophosphoryl diester phosphodiesterase [Desulfosarcina cetonica]